MSADSGDCSSLVGMPASITLPADPMSARRARKFVAEALSSEQTEQWEMAAKLLVTELVTNAILHARTQVTVTVSLEDGRLRLAVRDGSRRPPATRTYDLQAATGRGMALVERLSTAWGVDVHDDGKTVWVVLGAVDWTTMFEDDGAELPEKPKTTDAPHQNGPDHGMGAQASA